MQEYCGRVNLKPEPVPGHLDWDMYCGPSPLRPYHPHRFGWSHRYYWDYEGGGLADFAQHYMDPFQWIYGKDDTSPVEVEAVGAAAAPGRLRRLGLGGTEIRGRPDVGAGGQQMGPALRPPPGAARRAQRPGRGRAARRSRRCPIPPPLLSFVEAVKTRREAGGHVEAAHRAVTIAHLANIAIRLGRKIEVRPGERGNHRRRGGQPPRLPADAGPVASVARRERTRAMPAQRSVEGPRRPHSGPGPERHLREPGPGQGRDHRTGRDAARTGRPGGRAGADRLAGRTRPGRRPESPLRPAPAGGARDAAGARAAAGRVRSGPGRRSWAATGPRRFKAI